jgi:hypothetical protein
VRRVIIEYTCDVCGGDETAVVSVSLMVDGAPWDVDLCAVHAAAYERAVAPFVTCARRRPVLSRCRRG